MLKLLIAAGALLVVGLYSLGSGSNSTRRITDPVAVNPTASLPTAAANEVAYEITDTALTDQLNARLTGQSLGDTPLGPASLRRVAVEFRSGQVLTTGEAQAGPTSVPLSISSTIDLQAGKPVVAVHEATAAGVALPDASRRALQQAMQAQLDDALSRKPMHIRSLTITVGKLLAIGTPA